MGTLISGEELLTAKLEKLDIDVDNRRSDECHIGMIPFLVFEKIFQKLGTKDRQSVMNVCTDWNHVLNEMVGLIKYVGEEPSHSVHFQDRPDFVKWERLELIELFGIEKCTFGNINETFNDETDLPIFLNPDIVNNVKFYGTITQNYFLELMQPLRFISSLTFHLIIFSYVDFDNQPLIKRHLKYLNIVFTHDMNNTDLEFVAEEEAAIHKSLMSFLQKSMFQRIKSLTMDFPYFDNKVEALYKGIHLFAVHHQSSLKSITFYSPYTHVDKCPSVQEPLPHKISWEKVQLENFDVVPHPTINWAVEPEDYDPRRQSQNKYWTTLLSGQRRLKSINYNSPDVTWGLPYEIICNNANSLTSVCLTISTKFLIDCDAFKNCSQLTSLTLLGTGSVNMFSEDEDEPEEEDPDESDQARLFINASQLPASLLTIKIAGIRITTEEMNKMLMTGHLTQLKHLFLRDTAGYTRNSSCGLKLPEVHKLLNSPKIETMRCILSFNKPSILRGLKNSLLGHSDDEEVKALRFILSLMKDKTFSDIHLMNCPEDLYLDYNRLSQKQTMGMK